MIETPRLRGERISYEREIAWADLPHVLYRLYSPCSA